MEKKFSVSIVIPAYNEEKSIGQVIIGVKNTLSKTNYPFEILVIDDASSDKTAIVAKESGADVIKRKVNGGSGAARKTGILAAKGDIVVMLDGDGSYDPTLIPEMLSYFPEYDQVNGARIGETGTVKFLRVPMKWALKKIAAILSGISIPDLNTGLKAFKKDIILKYLWLIPDGFSCVSSITLAFLTNGYAVKYLPTKYFKRIGKSKFHPIKDTWKYFQTILRLIMYFNPLRIFLPLSLLIFTVGIAKSLYDFFVVIKRLQASDIIIILAAVFIFMFGLLADLIVAQGRQYSYLTNFDIDRKKTKD